MFSQVLHCQVISENFVCYSVILYDLHVILTEANMLPFVTFCKFIFAQFVSKTNSKDLFPNSNEL
jgi:hypothetical protein